MVPGSIPRESTDTFSENVDFGTSRSQHHEGLKNVGSRELGPYVDLLVTAKCDGDN